MIYEVYNKKIFKQKINYKCFSFFISVQKIFLYNKKRKTFIIYILE